MSRNLFPVLGVALIVGLIGCGKDTKAPVVDTSAGDRAYVSSPRPVRRTDAGFSMTEEPSFDHLSPAPYAPYRAPLNPAPIRRTDPRFNDLLNEGTTLPNPQTVDEEAPAPAPVFRPLRRTDPGFIDLIGR